MLHHQSEVIWTCDFVKVSPTNNVILTIDYGIIVMTELVIQSYEAPVEPIVTLPECNVHVHC